MPPSENLPEPAATARLAAILDSSDDAILATDLDGIIRHWNHGAEKLFGYPADEMVGTSIRRLIPPERPGEEGLILERVGRGEKVERMVTHRVGRDGRLIPVSITAVPYRNLAGQIAGISATLRDLTTWREREREITRLTRLHAALSHISQAVVTTAQREELFEKVCQALAEQGRFKLAWIAWPEPDQRHLVPVAAWGGDAASFRTRAVPADDRPEGREPAGVAWRENRPCLCNELLADVATLPWRAEFARRGLHALAAFPLRCQNQVAGTLNVATEELGFFHPKEAALLEEAAAYVSFGLDHLVQQEDRRQAEQKVRLERDVSNAMLKSLPGVFYLYDEAGRFLRWNSNFEHVTGYSAAELAAMHPLDFFAGADQARVAARIEEVFARGASSVAAGLVTKDGRVLPYYFTGVTTRYDGVLCLAGVGIDLTAGPQPEATLRESGDQLRATIARAVADAGALPPR